MNRVFFGLVLAVARTGCSRPSNFAECIIADMDDVQNPQVFSAIYKSCTTAFPSLYQDIEQGSGQGLFSNKDRSSCVLDNARGATFPRAAESISIACGCLYTEPKYKGQTCKSYFMGY